MSQERHIWLTWSIIDHPEDANVVGSLHNHGLDYIERFAPEPASANDYDVDRHELACLEPWNSVTVTAPTSVTSCRLRTLKAVSARIRKSPRNDRVST